MKKNYIAPATKVVELDTQSVLLAGIDSTNPIDPTQPSGIKGDLGIDFDDMTGADIVRKNPWDSEW